MGPGSSPGEITSHFGHKILFFIYPELQMPKSPGLGSLGTRFATLALNTFIL